MLKEGADYGWPTCYFDPDAEEARACAGIWRRRRQEGRRVRQIRARRSRRFPRTGRPTISRSTRPRSSRRDTKAAPSSPSTARGTARPAPQGGYNVVFQPMADGKPSGDYIVFADGFAGAHKEPGGAAHRPSGLAVGPDGALYITDDKAGRIWRVTYIGDPNATGIQAAPAPAVEAKASPGALPPEGMHPDAGLPVPPGATSEQVALGKKIFHGEVAGATCAGCHGADGIGTPVGADLHDAAHGCGATEAFRASPTIIKTGVPTAEAALRARCLRRSAGSLCRTTTSPRSRPMSGRLDIRRGLNSRPAQCSDRIEDEKCATLI